MKVTQFSDAVRFEQHASAFLERNEAENNLLLGVIGRLAGGRSALPDGSGTEPYLLSVDDGGEPIALGVMTPPYPLLLAAAPAPAVRLMAEHLRSRGAVLPAVLGPDATAGAFIEAWQKLTGQQARPGHSLRIYQLNQVTAPQGVAGKFRQAVPSDLRTLTDWVEAFVAETLTEPVNSLRLVEGGIREGRFFIWEDRQPVAMAQCTGPTRNGVRINMVYTLPWLRRKGYASACVAALSQRMLDEGRKFCFLFTDLANRTSNSIYQKIGYQPVCDVIEYRYGTRDMVVTKKW